MSSAIVLSVASLAASAEDTSTSFSWGNVIFQPRVYVGYADYDLKSGDFIFTDQNGRSSIRPLEMDLEDHGDLQFSGLIGGIGGTVAIRQFFGDFYYQSTPSETAYSSFDSGLENQQGGVKHHGDVEARHQDWALSLGYTITDQWSIFAGYKSGNTKWDQTNNWINDSNQKYINKINGKFNQNGPFLGTSYSFNIGPGVLNFKAAYAYLDGTYDTNEGWWFYPNASVDSGAQTFRYERKLDGNSNAFSIGISWTQPVIENLVFSVGANYHRYKFDLSGSGVNNTYFGSDDLHGSLEVSGGDLTEELFTLTAAAVYRF